MALKVRTDRKWKYFKSRNEVPRNVLANVFDYQDEDVSDSYFQYHGTWYHTDQFMKLPAGAPEVSGWDAYLNDSATTGVLLKFSPDEEQYQVASFRE